MSSLQKWASPINKSCKVNEDDVLGGRLEFKGPLLTCLRKSVSPASGDTWMGCRSSLSLSACRRDSLPLQAGEGLLVQQA